MNTGLAHHHWNRNVCGEEQLVFRVEFYLEFVGHGRKPGFVGGHCGFFDRKRQGNLSVLVRCDLFGDLKGFTGEI